MFVRAKDFEMNGKATFLVISPLVSITKDQILNMKSIGYSASFPKTRRFGINLSSIFLVVFTA